MTHELDNPFEGMDLGVNDADLGTVSSLADRMVELQKEIDDDEEALNLKKARLWKLRTDELPAAMAAVGLKDFTLTTGQKIEIKDVFKAGLPNREKEPELRSKAFEWLKANGAEELIRRNIVLSFGKGQDALADEAIKILADLKVSPAVDEPDVHWKTLTSWSKEQHEKGKALPKDLLGLHIGLEAKVKK